ncbi:phosphopantetheine-binding protein [Nonomuraea sp. NPDC049725]|uniref:phosphopantetheine-binding protein n=1 Tax=Nonomuraea sp. NPDC049725 TaxID=3154508 RepID=UPI00342465FF
MTDEQIFEELRSICVLLLGADAVTLTLDTDLRRDLKADSLELAELAVSAEDRFGLILDFDAAMRLQTMADAVSLVRAALDRDRPVRAG